MTDMMNMAINDMELDNVTGGATQICEHQRRRRPQEQGHHKAQQRHEGQNDRQQDQKRRLCMV